MTAPRSRASSTSRCCRSASRAHASCSSISPGCIPVVAQEVGETALGAVRRLVGDHVRHNAYFIDFPANVPGHAGSSGRSASPTRLADPRSAGNIATQLARRVVNLLDLPTYGRYQHTYEELLARARALIAAASRPRDRARARRAAGRGLARALPRAGDERRSRSPEEDLALLGVLAEFHVGDAQPEAIAVRESRAVVNRARLEHGLALELDTPVDVLRLACALSDGDVTLREPTRFRSLRRAERRALLAALDAVADGQARRRQPLRRAASSAWGSGCTRTSTRAGRDRAGRVRGRPRGARRRARSPAASTSRSPRATSEAAIAVLAQRARDAGAQRRPPGSRGRRRRGARGRGARGRPGGLHARAAVAARAPAQPLRHRRPARVRQPGGAARG